MPRVLPRIGPKPLIVAGQLLGAGGLLLLWRLEVDSGYLAHVPPALYVMGAGIRLIFGSCFNTATSGTQQSDAGVASALVNRGQQVGGALGTALLNTIAATAATAYVTAHQPPTPAVAAAAAVAGDTRAFLVSAGIFAVAAVLSAVVLPSGPNPAGRGQCPAAGH